MPVILRMVIKIKTLLLDIETAPLTVYCWGLREQDISLDQIIDTSYVLCWSAKWLGEEEILFDKTTKRRASSKGMIRRIHALLEQADVVVTFNGVKFDLPTLNKEFILHHIDQPAPYINIDLLKTARSKFRFASNKLEHLAVELGLTKKIKHSGFTMWIKCMDMDPIAWDEMISYNKQDVVVLEALYNRVLPWVKSQANHAIYNGTSACPNCGNTHYQRRGYAYTHAGKYPRYQCQACRSWFRGATSVIPKGKKVVAI